MLLGTAIPGWGHVYRGRLYQALAILPAPVVVIFCFRLTDSLDEPENWFVLVASILGLHLASGTWACLLPAQSDRSPETASRWQTMLFPAGAINLALALFVFKPLLLGIEVFEINADSMWPSLQDGDYLLVDTWYYRDSRPQPSDVIVFQRDRRQRVYTVKRVHPTPRHLASKQPDGIYVLGDNRAASLDSRLFGLVEPGLVIGRAKYVLHPRERFGVRP